MKKIYLFILGILLLTGCSQSTEDVEVTDYDPKTTIIGIEPGSGTFASAERAVEAYNLDQELHSGSSAVMTQLLQDAYKKKKPIVVTGWAPHWKFVDMDLKFLDDPKNIFGEESIHTYTRKGFKEDNPSANAVLDRFHWSVDEMQEVLAEVYEGNKDIDVIAKDWLDRHPEKYAEWTEGIPKGKGETVTLAHVMWDSEYASTYVISETLKRHGFKVRLIAVEAGPMYLAIENGDADATVCVWLPNSSAFFIKKHGDNMIDLGPNLTGARTGFVVPAYMDIDSIEDLKLL